MYLGFYKLREFPFSLTFDDRFFYEGPTHAEALANMARGLRQRKGMVLITGRVGSGKTFLGNMLLSRLGTGCQAVMMAHPPRSGRQLLRSLAGHLGMDVPQDADELTLVHGLQKHLIRMQARERLVVLVMDEAQDLTEESLEQVRLLWNWEQDGQRLVQAVLIGQPHLRDRLLRPEWESLRQRIVLSCHLPCLSADDTERYISHRLSVATDGRPLAAFTRPAKADIHAATGGVPRLINIVCDSALAVGCASGHYLIDRAIVSEVLQDGVCWWLPSKREAALADSQDAQRRHVEAAPKTADSGLVTRCPGCKRVYAITESKVGRNARCGPCGQRFRIEACRQIRADRALRP